MTLFAFLLANKAGIFAAIAAIHTAAVAIVNLTPTPKDDAAVAKFYRYIEIVAGVISPNAKL